MVETKIKRLAERTYSPRQRGIPRLEAPLQDAAAAAAGLLAPRGCRELLVIPELEVSGVRPDLWIGCVDEESFRKRSAMGIAPCTAPYPLAIAYELRRLGGSARIERLSTSARQLGERPRILRGVAELVERGIAVREEGDVRLVNDWRPAGAEGVAVEAKVGQWRKTLRQVQMWRRFVNGAWMVFPHSYLGSVPRQRPGTRAIGLATVEGDDLRVIRRPRLIVGQPQARALLEEHMYGRWLAEGLGRGQWSRQHGGRKRPPKPASVS
jgi:hypothetical protein